ncbi:hypothetical protein SmJEL517_g04932 [Synchytrium microbalum]|uniref:Enoyl-CoA hydratase n=1 Tax=Synchytrium microbalum TaxID=1806994 RepID=A0A507BXI2_9FUNG|nr:uncharacterized protein SmJEL517_g04932 [Synchytrium microbalum]TPX31848.1 hypothetical protein SmJEL517_g04932 [Synchytrium microbalum]
MTDYSKFKTLTFELVGSVAIVTLNRPNEGNAMDAYLGGALRDVFPMLDADDRVKCVIIAANGKHFCTGADFRQGDFTNEKTRGQGSSSKDARDGGGQIATIIHTRCRKPIIAAIQGSAVGVGITMTLPMDIRIACKDAKIGFVFVRRGIVMEANSSYFLPRLIGHSRALSVVLTGRVLPASHPWLEDLFSDIVDKPEDVLPRALELAQEIAKENSMVSIALTKGLTWRGASTPEGQHLLDSRVLYHTGRGVDSLEGTRSFMEKRPVDFKGSVQRDLPSFYPWWTTPDVSVRPSRL